MLSTIIQTRTFIVMHARICELLLRSR